MGHYTEARAGLAAARGSERVRRASIEAEKNAGRTLASDIVEVTPALAQSVADLAGEFGLRGYDAVHLGAASHIQPDGIASAEADVLRGDFIHNLGIIDARS